MRNKLAYLVFFISFLNLLAQPRVKIVIFDFKSVDEQEIGWKVAELIGSNLAEIGKYTVVERDQLEKLFIEQGIQTKTFVDESTAIELGKISGANNIVVGSIFQVGSKLVITARFLDSETGEVLKSESVEGKYYSQLPSLCKKVACLFSGVEFDRKEFELKIIQVIGYGSPPTDIQDKERAKKMAERAAILDAKRNLLEKIKGVQIDTETMVKDYFTQYDIIYAEVSGFIDGTGVINKKYLKDGSVEVTLEIDEKELKDLIKKNIE